MIKDGDLRAFEDKVIVKIDKAEATTASGIITTQVEKEMNRGEVVDSNVKTIKAGDMIYYKYGRTIKCETENKEVDYIVVEKDNIWCTDKTF